MKSLFLYTTAGCHLCEQAEALVEPLLPRYGLVLEPVEISTSDELMARYGVRIPVLRVSGSSRELGWPFSAEQAEDFLRRAGDDSSSADS